MPKFNVQVTGVLDWDYEIEAEDEYSAMSEAEDKFLTEHSQSHWSGVNAWNAEEIEDES